MVSNTQFTTSFLSAVKNNDALIQVVRLFRNETVPHPDGSIDPFIEAYLMGSPKEGPRAGTPTSK